MKVIFLDIDGVLNTIQGEMYRALHGKHARHRWNDDFNYNAGEKRFDHDARPYDFNQFMSLDWCPTAMSNLTWLLRSVSELRIVVSSVWRYGWTSENQRWLFVHYPEVFDRVIGRTPSHKEGPRGEEIQAWLDRHPEVESFVIIDDDADMEHLLPKLVQTDGYTGFQYHDLEKALDVLGVSRDAFSQVYLASMKDKKG